MPPARNSGSAAATNPIEYRRSLRVRPGVMNAHSWYSQTGEARMSPMMMLICTRWLKADSGSAKLIVVGTPLASWLATMGRSSAS